MKCSEYSSFQSSFTEVQCFYTLHMSDLLSEMTVTLKQCLHDVIISMQGTFGGGLYVVSSQVSWSSETS